MGITREQTQRLAGLLIHQAGELIENWAEMTRGHEVDDINRKEAAEQFAKWLHLLPGDAWHEALPPRPKHLIDALLREDEDDPPAPGLG